MYVKMTRKAGLSYRTQVGRSTPSGKCGSLCTCHENSSSHSADIVYTLTQVGCPSCHNLYFSEKYLYRMCVTVCVCIR